MSNLLKSVDPVRVYHLEIPLLRPFVTASGVVSSRSVALVRVGNGGSFGWAEASPYPRQDEAFDVMIDSMLQGSATPVFAAALNMAVADRSARIAGVWLGDAVRASMDAPTIGLAVGIQDTVATVLDAVGRGIARFKLKISPGNVSHVVEVRSQFPDVSIGVDANGSFDAETVAELAVLSDAGISYIEQPVHDLFSDECSQAREATGAPVFADESLRSADDARRLLTEPNVDGVVVKVGRLGWDGALETVSLARKAGKLWRASGLLETEVGRAYTNILAACEDAFLSDVASASFYMKAMDGIGTPSWPSSGNTVLGIGVDPDPDLLDRLCIERYDLS